MFETFGDNDKKRDLTPPFQPIFISKATHYEEKVLRWHSVGVKRDVLFYQFHTAHDEDSCRMDMLPDACINILFECSPDDPKALLSGLSLKPSELKLKPDTTYFGFKPFSDRGFKRSKLPLPDLVNRDIDLLELLPDAQEMLLQVANSEGLDEQIRSFDEYARKHMVESEYQPSFVDFFTYLLCSSQGTADLNEMQQMTGYSNRYCRERFKGDHGISPKQYSNIIRFQRTLKQLMRSEDGNLTALAADNGYYDQAHFIHDFKKFAKYAPSRFRKLYQRSDKPTAPLPEEEVSNDKRGIAIADPIPSDDDASDANPKGNGLTDIG